MPRYHRLQPVVWSIDSLLNNLDPLISWEICFYLVGALGIFLLVKFLGLSSAASMLAASAFILMPHFQALIIVGHFAKFRALMWMPYVLVTFLYMTRKNNFLGMLLFAFALALQLRTQHYQIIFYTLLLVAFMGIPFLYKFIKNKQWVTIGKLATYSAIAILLAIMVSAQNFLTIREYTPHSTRGGNAISIESTSKESLEKKGVGFDYATNWSYSVSELWNLIIPQFHGGTSNEIYTGDAVPAWKNRELPTYWGAMPFTQSYEYIGILVIFLAFIGIIFQWHRWEVKSLTFLTILAIILSLGKNFDLLYKLFFYYVPFFDKFRAPVMILTLTMFTFSILAAFGIQFILTADLNRKEVLKRLYFLFGFSVFLMIIPLVLGSSFALMQQNEIQRYGQDALSMLKKVRLEMLRNSTIISFIFLGVGIFGIWGIIKKWFRRGLVIPLFIGIIILDFMVINFDYLKGKFVDPSQIEKQYAENEIDKQILKDKELHRIFPVGALFSDVHWLYRHQSLGGYSPAKLQGIQEIVDNCLYKNIEGRYPLNWNVINMLNAKYVIAAQELTDPRLEKIASEPNRKLVGYSNKTVLPRALFIGNYLVIPDGIERLKYLNQPAFRPDSLAILEEEIAEVLVFPDSSYGNITSFNPEKLTLEVFTDKKSLLVISEVYYPPGWKALLDGDTELHIYKTNHLLRSVIIPEGQHSVEFTFSPSSYFTGVKISMISMIIIYTLLLGTLIYTYQDKIRQFIKLPKHEKSTNH
jgi:hypothetical protein